MKNGAITARLVADYLRRHPLFWEEHPELLELLSIPHADTGNTASLIERQVQHLRERNADLTAALKASQAVISSERALVKQAQALELRILETESFEAATNALRFWVKKMFAAHHLALFVFLDGSKAIPHAGIKVLGRPNAIRDLFAEVFQRNRPLYDSLQVEHLEVLFDAQAAAEVRSTAMMPVAGRQWDALVAVGSRDPLAYRKGSPVEVLSHVCFVFFQRVPAWLARAGCNA